MYEPLQAQDERRLHDHLSACAACRHEYQSLQQLVLAIPTEQPEFAGDLLPAIREELRRRPGRSRFALPWWHYALASMAVVALVVSVGIPMLAPGSPATEDVTAVASPVVSEMAVASARIDEGNYVGAYEVLRDAVREYPDDALAGEAQVLLADLAYSQLYRYADAYDAYETLRTDYNDTFAASSDSAERLALLAEAQQVNFASLEALEAARRAGSNGFEQLESIVGRYPTHMVAHLAAEEMGRIVAADAASEDGVAAVLALEQARDRCKDPVAIARLNIEVAEAYLTELHDGAQACTLFKQVLESGDAVLAQLAEETVARLGADCGA